MRYLLSIMLALLAPGLAYSQSVKVLDPSTGLPVFSAANPANVTIVGGGSGSSGTVAQASTTSGQSGMLGQCAATSSAPTYTTATTNPISCDTAGNLRVASQGNIASGATDSGNPVKFGGVYQPNASQPVFTAGQRGDIQLDNRGNLKVYLNGTAVTGVDAYANTGVVGIAQPGTGPGLLQTAPMVFDGTTWDRQRGDTNVTVVSPGLSAGAWTYTSGVTPILANTTTAVTIKAAAGASVRNMIDACQLTTTVFGASVPLAIRDGAGGTVIWALTVPTAGFLQPVTVTFPMALRGTANTLMEVVTTTANTSGTVTLSCQGHTGS